MWLHALTDVILKVARPDKESEQPASAWGVRTCSPEQGATGERQGQEAQVHITDEGETS